METDKAEIENEISKWRDGRLSKDEVRKLPSKIGKAEYTLAVPVLVELAHSDDPILRYNVIMSLAFKLQYKDSRSLLSILAETDPDVDCRDAAAAGLGFLFSNSHDCPLILLLAKIARNDSDEDVRCAAFSALLRVSGCANEEQLLLQRPSVDEATIRKIESECLR